MLACRAEQQVAADLCAGKIYVTTKCAIVEIEVLEFRKVAVDCTSELGGPQKGVLVDR